MLDIIPKPKKIIKKEGFCKSGEVKFEYDNLLQSESYTININENGIKVGYSDNGGKFYSIKTLEQIKRQFGDKIPCMEILDSPKYGYRGFLWDCSRHFFTIDELKKELEILASLKINKFHWHLTDDQGWRIEIKKYPRLTSVGGTRKSTRNDGKPVSGWYSQEEIKEFVSWCEIRNIEIIPEIDMPGHFTAAIAAYPDISCEKKEVKVSEYFSIHSNLACAGNENTYQFCCDILKEVFGLFPSKYIHLGGDEALKTKWAVCESCQNKIKENNLEGEEKLQGYFTNRIKEFCKQNNKIVINWNDGFIGGNLDEDIIMQYWKQDKTCDLVMEKEAAKGRQIILSPFYNYYFDYPYGMTNLKRVIHYQAKENVEPNVIGLEGTLWSEYIDNIEHFEYMIYPRILGLAEKAWSESVVYDNFELRTEKYLEILKKNGINYCKDYNPPFLKGKWQVVKFFANVINWDFIKKSVRLIFTKKNKN